MEMDKERMLFILNLIADDMKKDAESFDGKPFDGKTVAEYFGNQGAAIAALSNILHLYIKEAKDGN